MPQLEMKGHDRTFGLLLGVALLVITLIAPPPEGLSQTGWRVAGVALLMATWWITQALPIPATALAPLALFPLLGAGDMREAAAPYADPVIFLFLGGFIIGAGMQRWSLHERIGLHAIGAIGASPQRLVAGFLLTTALLSMWVSNSATAIMMLPVAVSVLALFGAHAASDETARANLGVALLLAVAYGASIGGLGTLIGTPPNALLAAYMAREHGVQIGFAQWMAFGVPVMLVMLAIAWVVLTRLYPARAGGQDHAGGVDVDEVVGARLRALGAMSRAETRMAIVFALTAIAWVARPLYGPWAPGLGDSGIAVIGALALFMIPSGMPQGGRLLSWDDLADLPWGVLLLFGGGLSLAAAISASGLAAWLAGGLAGLGAFDVILIVAAATLAMIFLTELTSNTASAAAFLPLGGAVAVGLGFDPILLAAPLALAASCAFMLPVATPPNAIVFASGAITIPQMARAGLWLNFAGAAVIVLVSYPLAPLLFGE